MAWLPFILLSVLTLAGGLGVVVTRNVVHAALFLLLSLVAVAGVYLILLAEFLALVQVQYAGCPPVRFSCRSSSRLGTVSS